MFDKEGAKLVEGIFKKAAAKGVTIHLPVDFVTGDKVAKDATVGAADIKVQFAHKKRWLLTSGKI